MIQKYNVTKVTGRNTKKDGTALVNKFGKPYFIIGIQVTQHGQSWINGFADSIPQWEGKEIELDIFEEEYNGTKSLKYKVPKAEEKATNDVTRELNSFGLKLGVINSKLDKIMEALKISTKPNPYSGLSPALQEQIKRDEAQGAPDFSSVKLPPEIEQRAKLAGGLSQEDEDAMNSSFDGLPM